MFEITTLRKIIGVHILTRMRNKNIKNTINQTVTIVQRVHERQHQWIGHVIRMNKNRIANTALHDSVEGTAKIDDINIGKIEGLMRHCANKRNMDFFVN